MYRIQNQIHVIDRIDHFVKTPAADAIDDLYNGTTGELMLEAADLVDVEEHYLDGLDYYPVMMLEAITAQASKLKHRMKAFAKALNQQLNGSDITAGEPEISKPRKSGAVAIQVAKIPMSDGQSVSLVFHAPDNDPLKINASDKLIAFRFLANSRDVTHLVAPSGGRDVSLKTVAVALSTIVQRNAPKFAKAQAEKQAQQSELDNAKEQIDTLEAQAVAINEELDQLQAEDQAQAKKAAMLQKQIDNHNEIQEDLRAQLAAKQAEIEAKAAAIQPEKEENAPQMTGDQKAIAKALKPLAKHFADLKEREEELYEADEAKDEDHFNLYDDYGNIVNKALYNKHEKKIAAAQKKVDTVEKRLENAFEAFVKAGGIEQQWDDAVQAIQGHLDANSFEDMLEDSGFDLDELRGTAPDTDELERQRIKTQGRMAYQQEIENRLHNLANLEPKDRKKMVLVADRVLGTGKSLKRGEKVADQAERISKALSVVESLQGETYASLDEKFANRGEIIDFLKEKNISFNRRATRQGLIEGILAHRDGTYNAINGLYDLAVTKGEVNKQFANGEALNLKDVEEAFGAITAYRAGDVVLTKHKGEEVIPAYDDQGADYQQVEEYVNAIEKGDFPDLDKWSDEQVFERYWHYETVTMKDILMREGSKQLAAEGLDENVIMAIMDTAPSFFFVKAVENEAQLRGLPNLDGLVGLKKGRLKLDANSRFQSLGTVGENDYFVLDYLTGERHGSNMTGAQAVALSKELATAKDNEALNDIFEEMKRGKTLEQLANEEGQPTKGDFDINATFYAAGVEVLPSGFVVEGNTMHSNRRLRDGAIEHITAFNNESDYTSLNGWDAIEEWLTANRGQITEVKIGDESLWTITISNMQHTLTDKGFKELRQMLGGEVAEPSGTNATVANGLKQVIEAVAEVEKGESSLADAKRKITDIAATLPEQLGVSLLKANARSRQKRQWIEIMNGWLGDAKNYDSNAPVLNLDGRTIDLNMLTYDIGDGLGRFGEPLLAVAKDHPQKAIEFIDADTLGLSTDERETVKEALKGYLGQGRPSEPEPQPEPQPEPAVNPLADAEYAKDAVQFAIGEWLDEKDAEYFEPSAFETLMNQVRSKGFKSTFFKVLKKDYYYEERKSNVDEYKIWNASLELVTPEMFKEIAESMEAILPQEEVERRVKISKLNELVKGKRLPKGWRFEKETDEKEKWPFVYVYFPTEAYDYNSAMYAMIAYSNENNSFSILHFDGGEYKENLNTWTDVKKALNAFYVDSLAEIDTSYLNEDGLEAINELRAKEGIPPIGDAANDEEEPEQEAEAVTDTNDETQHIEQLQSMRDFQGEATLEKAEEFQQVIESAYAFFEQNGTLDEHNDLLEAAFANLVEMQTAIAA